MLQIDKVQQIQNVIVYGDDESDHTFYILPQAPSFRLENGRPAFKFVKYRQLRQEGDDLFGGWCQANANQSPKSHATPSSCRQLTPLGQRGGAVLFESFAAVEVAVEVEVIVD